MSGMNTDTLLMWLSKEESSVLGECDGPELRELERQGLVSVKPIKGMHASYSRVSLTEAGWLAQKSLGQPVERLDRDVYRKLLKADVETLDRLISENSSKIRVLEAQTETLAAYRRDDERKLAALGDDDD
jgi:hypothetical protein